MPAVPAPRVSARYKLREADFAVEEIPAYEPSGEGTHTYLWIEKTGLSTLDAIAELARAVSADQRTFGRQRDRAPAPAAARAQGVRMRQ